MRRLLTAGGAAVVALLAIQIIGPRLFAVENAKTLKPAGSITFSGGPFLAPNPVDCAVAAQTCDYHAFTVGPDLSGTMLTIRVIARSTGDDLDIFLRDAEGNTIGSSTTETGTEDISIPMPPPGTYSVVVQPWLVVPGRGQYDGAIGASTPSDDVLGASYHGTILAADFAGVPQARPAAMKGQKLQVSFNYVGRPSAEPTIGVTSRNVAFYAAGAFDFPTATAPQRLARTVVFRSRDKGRTWEPVSPGFPLTDPTITTPPFSLDPMIHVDPLTDRVFSVDLYAACASAIFSDDEGVTWHQNPLTCGQPINDHHTIVTVPPPPGVQTIGYPNVVYYCFNRVADSSCGRSLDGGRTWTVAGAPAFTGVDPNAAGADCGGLHGHIAGSAGGRLLLPKGHCSQPFVAVSENTGETWSRFLVTNRAPLDSADHEVSIAADRAGNIYAVWTDGRHRLPVLAVSRDNGRTWSDPIVMAPPGVRETVFPTITAGDAGRIAVLFPGTTSADRADAARPWNIYTVVSIDALAADPTFTWTIANPANDPVHRGSCGPGRCDAEDGGSMFDFLDIQISPADGAFWGTASDTCTGACVTDPSARKLRPGEGVSIRQVKGPSLFVKGGR